MKQSRNHAHRLIPRSLTSHIILLVLAALAVSHLASFAILRDERRDALRFAAREQAVERLAAVIRLLEETPTTLHDGVIRAASTPRLRFRIVDRTQLAGGVAERGPALFAHEILTRRLGLPAESVRVDFQDDWRRWHDGKEHHHDKADEDDDDDDEDDERWEHRDRDDWSSKRPVLGPGMIAAIQLSDRRWIESVSVLSIDRPWAGAAFISLILSALGVVLIVTVLVRRAMRPVKHLSNAAERIGRGDSVPSIDESGPEDVRLLIRSFNTMQGRLDRFIRDRMTMLAAMSHDLRTPITTLRLRAELLEDGEDKISILSTLDELQQMSEEVLSFIRTDSKQEETRSVDVTALVDSVAEEIRAAGDTVTFDPAAAGQIVSTCRPISMKRAIRNIIENATRYGTRADIELATHKDKVIITINDDGPGIPEEHQDRLFEPFVRLETSRSRETGGVGLGLAIARSIVLAHGGDISLSNRPQGGLSVSIRIPIGS